MARDTPAQVTEGDSHVVRFGVELKDQHPSFKEFVKGNEVDDPESTEIQHGKEGTIPWGPGASSYMSSGLDGPNASYPYLPPVLEEPSSSFSEGFNSVIKFSSSITDILIDDLCSSLLY